MNFTKKSANINADILQQIENFIDANPGVNFTLIVNQALKQWLTNPNVKLNRTQATEDDVDRFLKDNSQLMDDLSK
jgi:hypothetical protein